MCRLISENWYIVIHKNTFRRPKYIAVFEVDKISGEPKAWEGRLTHLKNSFRKQVLETDASMR